LQGLAPGFEPAHQEREGKQSYVAHQGVKLFLALTQLESDLTGSRQLPINSEAASPLPLTDFFLAGSPGLFQV
jgi:hypothetical protein